MSLLKEGDEVKVLSVKNNSHHPELKVGDIGEFVLFPNQTKDIAVVHFEHITSGFDYLDMNISDTFI
ncbi:hypothetical protein EBB07_29205 [Paenibacillaceae bacterium]|nr:hypothetical protein EBB07_29205 [Paenibacillaceae bacterium]